MNGQRRYNWGLQNRTINKALLSILFWLSFPLGGCASTTPEPTLESKPLQTEMQVKAQTEAETEAPATPPDVIPEPDPPKNAAQTKAPPQAETPENDPVPDDKSLKPSPSLPVKQTDRSEPPAQENSQSSPQPKAVLAPKPKAVLVASNPGQKSAPPKKNKPLPPASSKNIEPKPPAHLSPKPPLAEPPVVDPEKCLTELSQIARLVLEDAGKVARPESLEAAEESFRQAQTGGDATPLLLSAVKQAQEARQNAENTAQQDVRQLLGELGAALARYQEREWQQLNGALYMNAYDEPMKNSLAVLSGDLSASTESYRNAMRTAKTLMDTLKHNLAWLEKLAQEVERLKVQSSGLRGVAAQKKVAGDEHYETAKLAREEGQLQQSETRFLLAQRAYQDALAVPGPELDRRLLRLQKWLEDSGSYSSVDAEGLEYPAPEWDGRTFLAENPLLHLDSIKPDKVLPSSGLINPGDLENTSFENGSINPDIEDTGISEKTLAGTEPEKTPPQIYDQAVRSWQEAVRQRNSQNKVLALEAINQGETMLEQYRKLYAVMSYYVVRDGIDSLWVISGYAVTYNDPFQWRRIYRRNMDIIEVPRLIYPGQRLLIPPPRLRR
ncbi:MAG: hypothetical protein AAF975_04785 [Spirochaetota bacterium]